MFSNSRAGMGVVLQIFRLVTKCQRLNLGLQVELAVTQDLNRFLREGCYVFHDIPEKSIGNIDHVVVASTGVFIIETKARSKRRVEGHESKLAYDGQRIPFPDGYETDVLVRQARRNAAWLKAELERDLADEVHVRAIVCYPGWFVEDRPGEKWDVRVRNPQRVNNVIYNERAKLTDK